MIVAISMVKDEADIIGWTLEHLRTNGVDRAIVYDNLSTDGTTEILASFAPWCETIPDPEFGYYQSRKMSTLAEKAFHDGATWVVPFDADEAICGDTSLAEFFAGLPDNVGTVAITGYDSLPRLDDNPDEPNPYLRQRFRMPAPQRLPKIAFRATPFPSIHMGNHDVDGVQGERVGGLWLRHVQYRSPEQMGRKLRNGRAVYEATDIHETHGSHWREGGLLSDEQIQAMWEARCEEPGVPWDQ